MEYFRASGLLCLVYSLCGCRNLFSHRKWSPKENKMSMSYLHVQLRITFTSHARCNTVKSSAGFVVTKSTCMSGPLKSIWGHKSVPFTCCCLSPTSAFLNLSLLSPRLLTLLISRFGNGKLPAEQLISEAYCVDFCSFASTRTKSLQAAFITVPVVCGNLLGHEWLRQTCQKPASTDHLCWRPVLCNPPSTIPMFSFPFFYWKWKGLNYVRIVWTAVNLAFGPTNRHTLGSKPWVFSCSSSELQKLLCI